MQRASERLKAKGGGRGVVCLFVCRVGFGVCWGLGFDFEFGVFPLCVFASSSSPHLFIYLWTPSPDAMFGIFE